MKSPKFKFVCVLFIILTTSTLAQEKVAPAKYWVQFTDKLGTAYSINKPEEFLSPRAVERRLAQGIPIEENDLPVSKPYLDSLSKLGFTILHTTKWLNAAVIEGFDSIQIEKVKKLPFVTTFSAYPKPDFQQVTPQGFAGNDLVHLSAFTLDDSNIKYGSALNQIQLINGLPLHKKGFRGEDMLIAVLDAGFNKVSSLAVFDSLFKNKQIFAVRDFVTNRPFSYTGSEHGMKVLSTMAANLPGKMIGTAPKANYLLLRSEDASSEYLVEESNWAAAAEFADSLGADIINSSLGYTEFTDITMNHKYQVLDGRTTRAAIAAGIAASKGILVVNSAGNEGNKKWRRIGTPADAFNILTVGAVDALGNFAYFSSVGPAYDGRTKPNVSAKGLFATVAGMNDKIETSSGTSFASPIMAGMAACLWQANPSATNYEIIAALQLSGNKSLSPDTLTGYGVPNFALADAYLKSLKNKTISAVNETIVFPNPFMDNIFIKTSNFRNGPVSFELFNMLGSKVYSTIHSNTFEEGSISINKYLCELAKGVYILKITSSGSSYLHRLVKH
jgi:serine protease AprX